MRPMRAHIQHDDHASRVRCSVRGEAVAENHHLGGAAPLTQYPEPFFINNIRSGTPRALKPGMKRRWFASLFLAATAAALAQNPGGWRKVEDPPANAPMRGEEPGVEQPQPQPRAQAQTRTQATLPGEVVIPAGTWITIRTDQLLSSDLNRMGDVFAATLSQPIVAGGVVLARRGQTITGQVTQAIRAGRVKGTSRLGVTITELSLADGQQIPIQSQLVEFSAGTSRGNDTATIGTVTGVGAAIGGVASGGFGAGMGAIAGAGASAIGVLLSRGRVTEIPPESIMRFRLMDAVTVDTSRAQQAFQFVQQNDYESRPLQSRVQVVQQRPTLWGGGWGGGWGYDPWFWGPGYGWGWGPGFYGNRIWIGGGGWNRGWGGGGWGGRGGGWGRRR
jgi:hypothetical protein